MIDDSLIVNICDMVELSKRVENTELAEDDRSYRSSPDSVLHSSEFTLDDNDNNNNKRNKNPKRSQSMVLPNGRRQRSNPDSRGALRRRFQGSFRSMFSESSRSSSRRSSSTNSMSQDPDSERMPLRRKNSKPSPVLKMVKRMRA